MGKAATRKRTTTASSDPALDHLARFGSGGMLFNASLAIGWRLAIMVLLPLFIGVQLDRRFDSAPSLTLAAFFIALFGAGMLIYRTYQEYVAETEPAAAYDKKSKKNKVRTN